MSVDERIAALERRVKELEGDSQPIKIGFTTEFVHQERLTAVIAKAMRERYKSWPASPNMGKW